MRKSAILEYVDWTQMLLIELTKVLSHFPIPLVATVLEQAVKCQRRDVASRLAGSCNVGQERIGLDLIKWTLKSLILYTPS